MQSTDEKYMKEAIKQAKKAYAIGEVPIGCVIVYQDKIIGRGYNRQFLCDMCNKFCHIICKLCYLLFFRHFHILLEILLKIFSSYLYSHNSIVMKDSENFYHKLSQDVCLLSSSVFMEIRGQILPYVYGKNGQKIGSKIILTIVATTIIGIPAFA